ncbi:RNA 3'-terminal phosphate cyclase [Contarinia nasturtii]|uniref:RNA 3'-terminal phosphate cyclase n=1 Tax=Contarinia nasturtii TaxID=265458 RepID=UPI0012D3D0EB|nr:RNA 3'-terminal phosphate cyclase [Contarinia nasturtii]
MILIDGSVMEGGGQILRMAISLSALLRKPVKITKIRAGRKNGGLAAQHLNGIELARDICKASAKGLFIGSSEVEFSPNKLNGGDYTADTKTAGSVALLLQVSLPLILFGDAPSTLHLKGGTNAEMAPQIDFMTEIFRPNLERFGATFDFTLERRGYFPRGGGYCIINARPVKYLQPIDLTNVGDITKIFGWSFVAGSLPVHLADEMMNGAKNELNRSLKNCPIDIEAYKETKDVAKDNASGIIIGYETTTHCILGASALGTRNERAYDTGRKAANELIKCLGSCVDVHVQDQLIIFMALARGVSRVRCTLPLTMHTKTAIYIAELITEAKFNVIDNGATGIIECNGISFENGYFARNE